MVLQGLGSSLGAINEKKHPHIILIKKERGFCGPQAQYGKATLNIKCSDLKLI